MRTCLKTAMRIITKGAACALLVTGLTIATAAGEEPQHSSDHIGHHAAVTDERQPITLSAADRDMVLAEMRTFLESVEAITQAIASGDTKPAAEAARKSGMAATKGIPKSLMQALPESFRQKGRETHAKFDDIAREAEDMSDKQAMASQLADILANCNACHRQFKLVSP